jgi:hypothetical protein
VVIGNVYNCAGAYTDLYEIPYIFNGDRTRWQRQTDTIGRCCQLRRRGRHL